MRNILAAPESGQKYYAGLIPNLKVILHSDAPVFGLVPLSLSRIINALVGPSLRILQGRETTLPDLCP